MYYIELATGLRRGELLGLKWADIDWNNGIIKVRRQAARVDGQIVEAPLKTKNSYRAVTISRQAIEVLKQQKEKINDLYVFPVAVPGRNFAWRSRLVSRRPLPLARLLSPATGGSRLAPPPPPAAPSRRTV
jgi:integrase